MVIVVKLLLSLVVSIDANSNEDALFYRPLPRIHNSPFLKNDMIEKDPGLHTFMNTVHNYSKPTLTSEDTLFSEPAAYSPLPVPWLKRKKIEVKDFFNTLQEEPEVAIVGGIVGATTGYPISNFWNYTYKKGLNLLEKKPALVEKWPKTYSFLKKATSPFVQRLFVAKAIGKFCIIGAGYAVTHSHQIKEAISKVPRIKSHFLN